MDWREKLADMLGLTPRFTRAQRIERFVFALGFAVSWMLYLWSKYHRL